MTHITIDGPLSPEAFKEIACKLEARIALDGKVRLLKENLSSRSTAQAQPLAASPAYRSRW